MTTQIFTQRDGNIASAFVHYKYQDFFIKCEAYFKAYGFTMVPFPPADVVIIDLDSPAPYPDVSGAKLTVLMSAKAEFFWRGELPLHDIFWEIPIDVWYRLDTIIRHLNKAS